ncbi:MAG: hypothetical protein ACYDFT_03420, partial [Thermoplasmata archaeon]
MPKPSARGAQPSEPPTRFQVQRDLPAGRHPLLKAFPGLHRLATARRQEPETEARRRRYTGTLVELVPQDLWMYVAPRRRLTTLRRSRFDPVVSPDADVIVVGEKHFRQSPRLILFLDIFHELCHL